MIKLLEMIDMEKERNLLILSLTRASAHTQERREDEESTSEEHMREDEEIFLLSLACAHAPMQERRGRGRDAKSTRKGGERSSLFFFLYFLKRNHFLMI